MTILSDRQIRSLCVAPTEVFDHAAYNSLIETQNAMGWPLTDYAMDSLKARFRDLATRPTTPEEQAAFVPMIAPFSPMQIKSVMQMRTVPTETAGGQWVGIQKPCGERKIISKGTTSYGYDVSLSGEFQIFTNVNGAFIDPKRPNPACLIDAKLQTDEYGDEFVWLPPNSYLLGWTEEYFRIPRDTVAVCVGKSTYARAGVQVNVTPIEPGFEGTVVIEVANNTSLPVKIYAHEGISQFLFFRGEEECETSYADRKGKYQGQTGIVHATV